MLFNNRWKVEKINLHVKISGMTTLLVKTNVPEELEEIFDIRLPRALNRIRILAEKMQ